MMTMSNDDFRWDCIKGTRAIKDEFDKIFATMSHIEIVKYINAEAAKINARNAQKAHVCAN